MEYILEKDIWTEADFDQMGWHDSTIYKMVLSGDLALDIDYIFKWNQPEVEGLIFTFWVAPSTLVFKSIRDLRFDLEVLLDDAFQIDDIEREETAAGIRWTIITQRGEMEFISEGYEQFVRQQPTFQYRQFIGYVERNGHSLERTTQQENPYLSGEAYKAKRVRDAELYDYAKRHRQKKLELESLQKKRENGEIGTKEYLLVKKELCNAIDGYGYWLKGTLFEPS